MPLTAETASQMIAASRARALALGIGISTAIVDADGRLFAFSRMEAAHWISVEVAQAKAFTGALLRRDGPQLQQMEAATLDGLGRLHGRVLVALGSVTTLREGDRVIAGIGCSGGTDDQDGECARAARDAYGA